MLTGYHFTTRSNWKKIKKIGLIPQIIENKEVQDVCGGPIMGIWCWDKVSKGRSKLGKILSQILLKNRTAIVLIKFKYSTDDMFTSNGDGLDLKHIGKIGNFMYHKEEKAIILKNPIPPQRIRLVKKYDLIKLID